MKSILGSYLYEAQDAALNFIGLILNLVIFLGNTSIP